jgi:hypothetical protein
LKNSTPAGGSFASVVAPSASGVAARSAAALAGSSASVYGACGARGRSSPLSTIPSLEFGLIGVPSARVAHAAAVSSFLRGGIRGLSSRGAGAKVSPLDPTRRHW